MSSILQIRHITEHSTLNEILANLNARCRANVPIDDVSTWLSAELATFRDGLGEAVNVTASSLAELVDDDAESCPFCGARLLRGQGTDVAESSLGSHRYCDEDHARRAGIDLG